MSVTPFDAALPVEGTSLWQSARRRLLRDDQLPIPLPHRHRPTLFDERLPPRLRLPEQRWQDIEAVRRGIRLERLLSQCGKRRQKIRLANQRV